MNRDPSVGRQSRRGATLVAAIGTLALTAACGATDEPGEADDQTTFELRWAGTMPETSVTGDMYSWWASEIEERTSGRVQFEMFFDGVLGQGSEMLPGLQASSIDAAHVSPPEHPLELPLLQAAGLLFVTHDAEAQTKAFIQLLDENETFATEFAEQGIHPAIFVPTPAGGIGFAEPLTDLDDFQGKRFRTILYATDAVSAVGGQPVSMPVTELYTGLQRGTIDGWAPMPIELSESLGLTEIHQHITDPGWGLYANGLGAFSLDTWDELPVDIQGTILEVSEEAALRSLEAYASADTETCDRLLQAGGSVTLLPESEVQEWKSLVGDSIVDEWKADAQEAGLDQDDADEFHAAYIDAIKNHEGQGSYQDGLKLCAERSGDH